MAIWLISQIRPFVNHKKIHLSALHCCLLQYHYHDENDENDEDDDDDHHDDYLRNDKKFHIHDYENVENGREIEFQVKSNQSAIKLCLVIILDHLLDSR